MRKLVVKCKKMKKTLNTRQDIEDKRTFFWILNLTDEISKGLKELVEPKSFKLCSL